MCRKLAYYITTPMFYVNAAPHLGHVYSAVLADAGCRLRRLLSPVSSILSSQSGGDSADSVLASGCDEHGLKIQRAAEQLKLSPHALCERVVPQFSAMLRSTHVNCQSFVRTSSTQHKRAVLQFWDKLVHNGFIEKGSYSGWYSVPDETFLSNSQVRREERDGNTVTVSAESGHELVWTEEDNYVFLLSRLRDELKRWADEVVVVPNKFHQQLLCWLEDEEVLHNLSVSRPVTRLQWGIPVPGDDTQVIYVWVDALVSYLTAVGYPQSLNRWPPDCQVFGKDILKFHCIYWPALLMAAGFSPPKHLVCHSHWTVDGRKMSKSLGNVVAADQAVERFTADGLRYFLLREATLHTDANYSDAKAVNMLNAELADTLCNLLSRSTGKVLNAGQTFPTLSDLDVAHHCGPTAAELLEKLRELPDKLLVYFCEFDFSHGLEFLQSHLRHTNQFFQEQQPWKLRELPEHQMRLQCCLYVAMETVRVSAILLQPAVPNLASTILDKLGIDSEKRSWRCACSQPETTETKLGIGETVLFKKLKHI